MAAGVGGNFRRDGIVAEGAPWVAAEQAARGEPKAAEWAVNLNGCDGVVRAGGLVAAGAMSAIQDPQAGRDRNLIEADWDDEKLFHQFMRVNN